MVDQMIADRFQNALTKGRKLASHDIRADKGRQDPVEPEPFLEWQSRSLTLLRTVFGPDHAYTKNFETGTSQQGVAQAYSWAVQRGMGVLPAAEEDHARGWTWGYREVLHGEVFDDLLDMAEHLVKDGG